MPFVAHFSAMGLPLGWLVIAVAALASLGSMLALLAGVSRTAAEMAKDGAITALFAKRNRFGSPWMAEIFIALIAGVLVFSGPISWVISLSSLGVLFYYAVGHLSALAQPDEERIMPKFVPLIGLALCLILASSAGLLFAEGLQPR
jgi:APA family basic amino acid/polyamine antiporter